ncbi:phosphotransferase family protein [Microlunatus speluncae]|uniref:phosphotransferase family protein n=1 Tax=Microlunatus speluncae TaxID=2594267 RepID=UPI0012664631|nr:phosphotransferase [Microlunatus speluncae]
MPRTPLLDQGAVEALAARLFGRARATVTAVATPGMETQAYRVTDDRLAGCLRIGAGPGGFRKDAWAHDTFGSVVPVPAVRELGVLPDGAAYCLTDWVDGVTLQDLPAAEARRVTPLVFDAWSRLQTAAIEATTGYGELDPATMTAPYRTPRDRLRSELDSARRWPAHWVEARRPAVTSVLEHVQSLIDCCPDQRAFVHGDWGCNNLLVDDGRVAAVLDWATAGVDDPIRDVAGRFWAFWPAVSACVTALADHADRRLGDLPAYRDRVLCHDLRTGISEITDCHADGDLDFADRCLARCLELIEDHGRVTR